MPSPPFFWHSSNYSFLLQQINKIGTGATTRMGQEIQCLPYAWFFLLFYYFGQLPVFRAYKNIVWSFLCAQQIRSMFIYVIYVPNYLFINWFICMHNIAPLTKYVFFYLFFTSIPDLFIQIQCSLAVLLTASCMIHELSHTVIIFLNIFEMSPLLYCNN